MKILWLVNIIMPELAQHLGRKPSVFGGWLTGAMQAVRAAGHQLVICTTTQEDKLLGRYDVNGVTYYVGRTASLGEMKSCFRSVLDEEKPDVVHLYGTEFEHDLALAQVCDRDRTLVTIQGALIYCKDNVYSGLPEKLCRDNVLHKILRKLGKGGISIELQKRRYDQLAKAEEEILKTVKYINGGSAWGNAVARSVNPDCTAFGCGLILRDSFYGAERWSVDKCEKHSIYILHSYPIKGFHKFLDALAIVAKRFPDTKVYVASSRIRYRRYGKLKTAIMDAAPDYPWIIQRMIEEKHLQDNIVSLGYLSEEQVKEYMLRSNVFVSASSIENQSTTLGEAMILGVPSAASCVGAIQEMICDGEDGFIYPYHEPYVLADRIIRIFEDDALAQRFSVGGHLHAARTYDREENARRLLEMYDTIVTNVKEAEK